MLSPTRPDLIIRNDALSNLQLSVVNAVEQLGTLLNSIARSQYSLLRKI